MKGCKRKSMASNVVRREGLRKRLRTQEDGTPVLDHWTDSNPSTKNTRQIIKNQDTDKSDSDSSNVDEYPFMHRSNHLTSKTDQCSAMKRKNPTNRKNPLSICQDHFDPETSDTEGETAPKKRAKATGKNNRCPLSEKSSKDVISDRNIPEATSGLRRSSRFRVPPLDFWRNERLVFKALPSGDVQCMGIDKGSEEDNYGLRQILRKREAREKKSQKKKVGKTVKNTSIRDVRTGRTVQMLVHRPLESLEWTVNPNEVKETPSYHIGKSFTSNTTSFGFLDISPFSSKETQISPIKNLHFVLIKGHLEVTIQDTKFNFTVGDSWIVPMGVPYSIRNCKRAKALVSFSTFKE